MKDLVGRTFGEWLVLEESYKSGTGRAWLCRCSCGAEKRVLQGNLTLGKSKRCRHCSAKIPRGKGACTHRLYSTWKSMKTRCNNPLCKSYPNYGGRGIVVCSRWENDFWAFVSDMYPTFKEGLTLDRTNNDLGYSPENCKWVTHKQQSLNTRVNVFIHYKGVKYTESQAAEFFNIKRTTIQVRRNLGWSDEEIIEGKASVTTRCLTYKGKHYNSITELATAFGIKPLTLAYRIRVGWSIDKAVNKPVRGA